MTYILVLLFVVHGTTAGGGVGSSMTSAEFSSKESCMIAAKGIAKTQKRRFPGEMGKRMEYYCVAKDIEKAVKGGKI